VKKKSTPEEHAERIVERMKPFLDQAFNNGYVAGSRTQIDWAAKMLDAMAEELVKKRRRGRFPSFGFQDALVMLREAAKRIRMNGAALEVMEGLILPKPDTEQGK
jgi:hypothetical protein